MSKLKNSVTGFFLAWQFFSSVPVNKQLHMNKKSVTWMYASLPIIGLIMGSTLGTGIYLIWSFSNLSNILLAILLVVGMIVLTGGLHLDGWTDMSDAFFSYGDKEKRLAILDDPRTGAFGVISVVCLLLLKVGFIFETLEKGQMEVIAYIAVIPFIARIGMLLYFLTMPTSKKIGLAAYFKGEVITKMLWLILTIFTAIFIILVCYFKFLNLLIVFIVMIVAILLYRKWTTKHFGGMSGDLLGALGEGLEVLLWLVVLFCI
ncbi:MAG: adenosylcobinamide-GDP ribazoletransferase [Solibacillus sp.]|uniref:adenosylcobinamide-GDP ribazoletransferase n=1 Tax=Solibacillus sp. TaxID=1909654 RepID=UPI003314D912